jgi:hypothetical protein
LLYIGPDLLSIAPALIPLAVGVVLSLLGLFISPWAAYRVAVGGLMATFAIGLLTLLWSGVLPDEEVSNGPIGATCPVTSGGLGHVQTAFAISAVATAAIAVAGAISSGVRGHSRVRAAGLVLLSCFLPYLAVIGWLIPRLCDYS